LIVRLEEEVEPKSALYAQTRQDTATNPTGRQPALEYERGCVQGSSPDAINSSRDIQAAPTSLYRRELPLQGAAPQSPQRTTAQPEATYPPQAPPVARKIEQELSFTPMRDTVPDRWWPNITVSRQDAETLQVVVAAPGPITHHSFRLKEPDRYVIDFPGVRELSQVSHPALAEGDLVKQIRLGNPDADPSILRMVLDLSGTDVLVTERKSPDGHMLALAITKVNSSLASIRVPPGMTVVIDPGHGGSDPGAERAAVQEKELTLAIAKKMSALLRQGGVRTILTRDQDSSVSLEERINQTNSANPHAFVSIHINSLESKSDIHGIETYFQTQQSRGLAEKVHNALVKELNAPDRDIRRAKFYVINHTPVPAVLAEVGFLSHPEEREKLISSEYQMKVATGLARGVMLYLTQNSLAVAPARKIIGQAPLPGIE